MLLSYASLLACVLFRALQAVLRDLECRLALGRTTLRNTEQLAAGVLQAPIGSASVVFCTMVGYSTLLAWDKELAQDALAQYTKLANALLSTPGGAKTAISGRKAIQAQSHCLWMHAHACMLISQHPIQPLLFVVACGPCLMQGLICQLACGMICRIMVIMTFLQIARASIC